MLTTPSGLSSCQPVVSSLDACSPTTHTGSRHRHRSGGVPPSHCLESPEVLEMLGCIGPRRLKNIVV